MAKLGRKRFTLAPALIKIGNILDSDCGDGLSDFYEVAVTNYQDKNIAFFKDVRGLGIYKVVSKK